MGLLQSIPNGEVNAAPSSDVSSSVISAAALADTKEGGRTPQENAIQEDALIGHLKTLLSRSELSKRPYEQLWLDAHRNYRGLYGSDVQFTSTERSRIFIKVTKTKINAAFGNIMDVLFADNKFPIAVEPERLPEGVIDTQSVSTDPAMKDKVPQGPQTKVGFKGDGTREGEKSTLAAKAFIGETKENEAVYDGAPVDPSSVEYDVPLLSAKKIEKKIQDQLKLSNADKFLRQAAFECVCLGTGCMKGPVAVSVPVTEFDADGQPVVKMKIVPRVESVSIWDIYPDADANNVENADYNIQRHKLSKSQVRSLKQRAGFRANEIDALTDENYNYVRKWWEPMIQDMPIVQPLQKYEVYEYWGVLDAKMAREYNIDVANLPPELKDAEEWPVNIWWSGNRLLRLVINPFNNGRMPYYIVPYEVQPYVMWGIGVAESMSDTQMLMNGFMRLAVDNAVLAGNLVFEIDETMLVPGQSYDLYPGKFFRKQGGQQGQSIYSHQFPDTAKSNMDMYNKARELADEATFPSYTHGNTGVNPSLGRTSSGLSMMMGAASVGIRMAIKNFDDYLLTPLGQAMFEFNKLTAGDDDQLKGNFVVEAGGTDTLMRNEVKSQRLLSFVQLLSSNPQIAPLGKWAYLIRETARLLDLDPDKSTNTMPEALRMAALLKTMAPPQNQGSQPAQGEAEANPAAGQTALPGESSFSANKTAGPATHASPGTGVS